jgi:predicted O-linked N-acetylglucosamine transferase (SPINDLY family)
MVFDQDTAETIAPLLGMIGQEARLDSQWTCQMLDAVAEQVLPVFHRQQREAATSHAECVHHGLKLALRPTAEIDDLMHLAHSYANDEKLFDALYWASKAIELHLEDGEFLRFKASILERMGRFEKALQTAHEAQLHGADLESISADIDRINARLISYLREASNCPDDESSLPASTKLLAMGQLTFPQFIKFIGKVVSAYAKRS